MSNITKLPTVNQFTMKALAGEYSRQDIEAINSLIAEKKEKLQDDLKALKELEKLTTVVAKALADSVDNEQIYGQAAHIVVDGANETADEEESTKVM